jgi:formylglycine-generating enzyme required for sulfatase activity
MRFAPAGRAVRAGAPVTDQIRKIQEYVYAKYVDPGTHGTLDEEAALRVLEEHYRRSETADDPECYVLGVLYFELGFGFEDDTRRADYFRRAKYWLERWKALTGEEWDAVTDRLADIHGFFAEHGLSEEAPQPVGAAPSPVSKEAPTLPKEIDDHGPMVLVPAGSFLFGPDREARTLPAFYIDKFPVTNRQYDAFCRATQYRWPKYWKDARFNQPDQPVVGVSVADAQKYCKWVGKDLPSEEMWEKAARGTDGRHFPWGDDKMPTAGLASYGKDPEIDGPDPVQLHPAGSSPFGVQDLVGNVWEWTATTIEDGETLQIVKGGCFSDPPELIRVDQRLEAGPKDKFENIGFRCARMA